MRDSSIPSALRVSVVIPTLNREKVLINTVNEILSVSSPYLIELIVVDQSGHPSNLPHSKDKRLIYRHVDFKNLPRARNYGTAIASGDVVLFLDDDVASVKHVVDSHALAHIRTGASVVTGPILTPGEALTSIDALTPEQQANLRTGELFISNLDVEYVPLFAPGGNSSYRREVLVALGGFDENFVGSARGEDAVMSYRVKKGGGTIIYDPAASLVHLHVPMGGCRDEADEWKADETSVYNAHYFANMIDQSHIMPIWFYRIVRTRILNRRTVNAQTLSTLARRISGLLAAWWRARSRTRELRREGARDWLASARERAEVSSHVDGG